LGHNQVGDIVVLFWDSGAGMNGVKHATWTSILWFLGFTEADLNVKVGELQIRVRKARAHLPAAEFLVLGDRKEIRIQPEKIWKKRIKERVRFTSLGVVSHFAELRHIYAGNKKTHPLGFVNGHFSKKFHLTKALRRQIGGDCIPQRIDY
jgi:hypothetical protein